MVKVPCVNIEYSFAGKKIRAKNAIEYCRIDAFS